VSRERLHVQRSRGSHSAYARSDPRSEQRSHDSATAELRATRRELAAARRALQERRTAASRHISREDTVRALGAVLQQMLPCALDELRAERDRLARDLASARVQLRTA
jgi:hypothetical protein